MRRPIRVAGVQLDYVPTRRVDACWLPGEPLTPRDPLQTPPTGATLTSLATLHPSQAPTFQRLLKESRESYLTALRARLSEILNFCHENKVDLVVFPEYPIPVSCLDSLRNFSSEMIIVAGLGYLQRDDIPLLESHLTRSANLQVGQNAAVLLSAKQRIAFAKKSEVYAEEITSGRGPTTIETTYAGGDVSIGVAICLDFMTDRSSLSICSGEDGSDTIIGGPDIIAIPTLTTTMDDFLILDRPLLRSLRVVANHAYYGGTLIAGSAISGGGVTDTVINGKDVRLTHTAPIPPGLEGIVVADYDLDNPFLTVPKSSPPKTKLFARTDVIYSGRDVSAARLASDMCAWRYVDFASGAIQRPDSSALITQWGERYPLLAGHVR